MRHILLVLILSLAGCTSIPGMPGHITATTSSFDGSRSVSMKPVFLITKSNNVPVSFGMYWNSKIENNTIVLTVRIARTVSISNGESLKFRVDGELFNFISTDRFTAFGHDLGASSSKRYIIPISFIDKINEAKSVKVRVELSKSYAEADYSLNASSSIKSNAIAFMAKTRN